MSDVLECAVRAVLIGVGATLVMDLWTAVLRHFEVPSLNLAFLGRWIGHLPGGRWTHPSIASATPIRGELLIGWCAHYAIGIVFAGLVLCANGVTWGRSPSLLPALFIGIVTVVAPLFILQPGLGAGIASSKTSRPVFNALKSLGTHVVFGVGLYLAAIASAWLLPVGR